MPRIWKFPLQLTDEQSIKAPAMTEWLHVTMQNHVPTIWGLVDHNADTTEYIVHIFGTGQDVPELLGNTTAADAYLGTAMDDPFVWHVFVEDGE